MTRRRAAGLLAVAIGPLGWCLAFGAILGGQPMLALEIGIAALAALWAAVVGREVVRAYGLSRALAAEATEAELFGVSIWVTPVLGRDALVVGSVRPRIYVGAALIGALSDDEIRGVVLHEDHHRRTHAPLRAAALGAWLSLFGRSKRIRDLIVECLADLETLADADAIRRGSSPRSLAGALLKGDPSLQPVSFAYASERRVEQLLDRAAGRPVAGAGRLPYEWLPVIVLAVVAFGCNAGL